MHWFDRLSRQIAGAPEAQTTRRGVLRGVGAAAVAAPLASHTAVAVASPLASYTATYTKNTIKARQASNGCSNCIVAAYRDYKSSNKYIKRLFARNGKGKHGKLTLVQAAALQSYLTSNRDAFIQDANACLTGPLCTPAAPPTVPVTGSTTCPPGTGPCPGGGDTPVTCCYGGDACCVCANVSGGYICCAGVIGCTCC